jgi:hypothetical protein
VERKNKKKTINPGYAMTKSPENPFISACPKKTFISSIPADILLSLPANSFVV